MLLCWATALIKFYSRNVFNDFEIVRLCLVN